MGVFSFPTGNSKEYIHLGAALDPLDDVQGYLEEACKMDHPKQAQDAAAQLALTRGMLKIRQAAIYAVQTSMEKDQKFSSGEKGPLQELLHIGATWRISLRI